MTVLVLGAGAWGTALAVLAARTQPVRLWARDPGQRAAMDRERCNRVYLPGVVFPPALSVLDVAAQDLAAQLRAATLVVLAGPVAALRPMLTDLVALVPSGPGHPHGPPVVWLCKGFEAATGRMPHEVQAEVAPGLRCGVLSGPSFAQEVAAGLPAALVAASRSPAVTQALVSAFHGPTLRVYVSDDLTGVEVGGAVKNVLAIATGLCDGLQLGANARAALVTRGLAEMSRLGMALGARADTFMGLSGLGDLVLTATGDLSRNRKVGQLLATGQSAAEAVASLGHVAEGVLTARTVVARARQLGVDMPIAACVVDLLDGRLGPAEAVRRLMQRESRAELAAD